jgi:deoxyribonuclease V
LSPREASALQTELAKHVVREMRSGDVATVAGIDVGIHVGVSRAAVVVLDYPSLKTVEYAIATRPVTFPYIPGLLSFREGPVILDALDKLSAAPDLLIFDGQGMAHPRRLGIASHIGLLVDLPSIGCAKSRLCGKYKEPGLERGSRVPLMDKGETVGSVVRTRTGVKPVFVSLGHRLDLQTSVDYVLACCRGYRLPETTRRAHLMASKTL